MVTFMDKVFNIKTKAELVADAECIKLARNQVEKFDIQNYDALLKPKYVNDVIIRGYDLVINHYAQANEEEIGSLIFTFREFLDSGEVRKVVPSKYFWPEKERNEAIENIRRKTVEEIKQNELRHLRQPYPCDIYYLSKTL